MRKIWLVARAEYLRLVKRRAFIAATVGMPLFIAAIIGFSVYTSLRGSDSDLPLGYVDEAGITRPDLPATRYAREGDVSLKPYASGEDARTALEAGELQAFYLIPADYGSSGRLQLSFWDSEPGDDVRSLFNRYLRASLLAGEPEAVRVRASQGVDLVLQSADGRRQATDANIVAFILPFFVGMFFMFVVIGTSGYLLQAVTTEKENRMVEVMFTSASPAQIIGGKVAGLMAIALTQALIWVAALAVGLVVGARYVDFLRDITVPWSALALAIVFFLPSYAIVAGLMTTLGSMVTELQQAQQIAGLINMLFIFPFFFTVFLFTDPNGPIMVALSLFPTTSFLAIAMRWGVTTVPLWQVIMGWLLVLGTAAGSIFVAARIFRVGMLRYGQSISLRGLARIVRAKEA